jgi:hypothetical protein
VGWPSEVLDIPPSGSDKEFSASYQNNLLSHLPTATIEVLGLQLTKEGARFWGPRYRQHNRCVNYLAFFLFLEDLLFFVCDCVLELSPPVLSMTKPPLTKASRAALLMCLNLAGPS